MNAIQETKDVLRMVGFSLDPWGVVMGARFDLCDCLDHFSEHIPDSWRFRQSPFFGGPEPENIFVEFLGHFTEDDRQKVGAYLKRLSDFLEYLGKDY